MHSAEAQGKGDISILPGRGHFYFALTNGRDNLLLAVESARIRTAESFKMTRLLRSAWIWAATGALILLWVPLLGAIRLFDVEPRRLRTGRWFRRLGRVVARVNPWRI